MNCKKASLIGMRVHLTKIFITLIVAQSKELDLMTVIIEMPIRTDTL